MMPRPHDTVAGKVLRKHDQRPSKRYAARIISQRAVRTQYDASALLHQQGSFGNCRGGPSERKAAFLAFMMSAGVGGGGGSVGDAKDDVGSDAGDDTLKAPASCTGHDSYSLCVSTPVHARRVTLPCRNAS